MTDILENPSGKQRILFGFKSVPYPLRADGVAVRYLPIIEYMSQRHEVDLLVISGGAGESPNLDGLRSCCRKIFVLQDPRRSRNNMVTKCKTYANFLLPWTPPLSVVAHDGSMVTRGIVEVTRGEHYDAMVWVGGDLLPCLMDALPSMSVGKVFIDFIDSPFLWATRRKEKPFRSKLLDLYEQWKTCRWEGDVIRRASGTIYISQVDAEAVPSGHAPMEKRHVVPNGINPPSGVNTERASLPSPNIGFLGTMGYPPNIEAVEWLYKEVFVPLRKIHTDLTLVVIGRYPSQSILDLAEKPGVIVTGGVDDVWPYINGIDVFLFPLLRGAGLKNKILEAMYAGRPVITTKIGNEGIEANPGQEFVLCRTPKDFQREAIRLLNSPEERARMGNSACAFVNERFSWVPILSAYENLTLGTVPVNDPVCYRKKDSLAPTGETTEVVTNNATRILILTDVLGGGTGNHLLSMIKHWDKSRWQVEILSRAPVTARVSPDIPVRQLPLNGGVKLYPFAQIRALGQIRREIVERLPHIVHTYFFWSILFGRMLKREGKIGTLIENREDQGFNWGVHEYSWLQLTRGIPDRIICVSDAVKQTVIKREREEEDRIIVIRNGIEALPDARAEAAETRKELGIEEEQVVVGMVANFNRSVKGVSLFLDAVPEIVKAVPAARFLLLGRGKEEKALRDKARAMGIESHVLFAGYRQDIHRYYAVMDVSALTSFSEGLSITLLESMRCGVPVVATRVGGNPEVVIEGETGYLVPPGDVPAFVSRTIKLLLNRSLRIQMGEEGRRRVERHFLLRDVASRYQEIYKGMLSRKLTSM